MSALLSKNETMSNDTIDLICNIQRLCERRTRRLADVEQQLSVTTEIIHEALRNIEVLCTFISDEKVTTISHRAPPEVIVAWDEIENSLNGIKTSLTTAVATVPSSRRSRPTRILGPATE